ncbi:hypothetical protein GOP47_0025198 [Adiantum capillus-veneris]|uniref:Uncharacterized protein n=1 Tax=Adiantum capillus-veneris TaxID=13818 RepID=A0A9D4U3F8_ADICA|nr:hypothetical protein GOP47_0025198 [Adiantum capillus-veneris]
MCQGVFPSAFNSCDCPRSELLPYPAPCKQQHHAKHPPEGGHSDLMEKVQQGSMYASSLWAKWVNPTAPPHPHVHPHPNQAQQATALGKPHIIRGDLQSNHPDKKQIGSASSPLDRPHLVHAFFFDST